MTLAIEAPKALREVMNKTIPATGAKLNWKLVATIKRDLLALLKVRGYDLDAHKREIKIRFTETGQPNLIIPPHLLH